MSLGSEDTQKINQFDFVTIRQFKHRLTNVGRFLILKTPPELYPNPTNEKTDFTMIGRPVPYTEEALPH